ncbi:MAG: 30S ribosomal protein S3 [Dysosmobacter welbionis]
MGQKVNPHGLRVGVIKDWDSRWYASDEKVGDLIVEDQKIRKYLKKTLYGAGVPKIEIERSNEVVTIFLHCARPGMVIGKGGEQIEQYRLAVEKLIGKKVRLNIVEVRNPDMNAQLVAENIAQQLEKRISHRRAMKNAMARAMRAGAKGIKVCCSGRLGGREIAGVEHYHEGTIPLQTIRADIEYGFAEAATTFGRIGVKVWIYKGEVLSQTLRTTPAPWTPPSPTRSVVSVVPAGMATAAAVSATGARAAGSTVTVRAVSTAARAVPRAVSTVPPIPAVRLPPRRLRHPLRKEEPSNASAEESQVSPCTPRPYDRQGHPRQHHCLR